MHPFQFSLIVVLTTNGPSPRLNSLGRTYLVNLVLLSDLFFKSWFYNIDDYNSLPVQIIRKRPVLNAPE